MLVRLILTILFLYCRCFGFSDDHHDYLSDLSIKTKVDPQDKFIDEANTILAERGDINAAKICLIKSFALYENGEAAFILGKMHLFGTHSSATEQMIESSSGCSNTSDIKNHRNFVYYQGNYTEELSLTTPSPNLTRAYLYFNYAHNLGNADAGVFLYYIYKQSQILSLTENSLIPQVDPKKMIKTFNLARYRGSLFANLVLANTIITCNKVIPKKSKEIAQLKNFSSLPILQIQDIFEEYSQNFGDFAQGLDVADIPCRECDEGLVQLIPVLSEVSKYLQSTGGSELPPPRLDVYHQDIVKNGEDVDIDISSNIEILKQQAERGDVNSQVSLGDAYFFGNPQFGIERNLETAERYYSLAANQNNNPHAQGALGIMKMQGIGVERNKTEAVDLFFKSANQGEPSSMNALGYAYLYGSGVKQNVTLAMEWLEKAALLNHTESEGNLGSLLKWGMTGIKKDEKKALFYLLRAAKKGQVLSIFNLAALYLEKRYDRSFTMNISCWEIFYMASEAVLKGDFNDYQLQAFKAYRDKEFDKSYIYYSFGAMLGFVDSVHASEFLWEKQRPEKFQCKDQEPIKCALAYYYQLYLLGDEKYLTHMADLVYNRAQSKDSVPDLNRAFKLYNYSVISNKDPRALHSMAWMLEKGSGTEKNENLALKYYEELTNGYLSKEFEISAFIVDYSFVFGRFDTNESGSRRRD